MLVFVTLFPSFYGDFGACACARYDPAAKTLPLISEGSLKQLDRIVARDLRLDSSLFCLLATNPIPYNMVSTYCKKNLGSVSRDSTATTDNRYSYLRLLDTDNRCFFSILYISIPVLLYPYS
jgi:hypothetical protein